MRIWHHTKRISVHVSKKAGHLFFPYIWHYFTDDYKDRMHHLVIDTLLSFVMLILVGSNLVLGAWLYLFSIHPTLEVKLYSNEPVISGAPLDFKVELTTGSKQVNNVDLKLTVPSGFKSSSSNVLHWNHLDDNSTEKASVSGFFEGDPTQPHRAIAVYTYHYFGQTFTDYTVYEFKIATSSLEIVTHAPDSILNNQTFTWQVEYFNSGTAVRDDTCIKLAIPPAFRLESSTLPIEDGVVHLPAIEPQTGGIIDIVGSFSNAIGEGSHVIDVSGVDDCSGATGGYNQLTVQQPVQVLTPRLQVSATGPASVNVGDTVTYTITYTNTGDANLSSVTLNSDLIDWDGRYRSASALQLTDADLKPGETRKKYVTVVTNPSLRQKNVAVGFRVSGTATIADLDVTTFAPAVISTSKFNSTLNFTHVARYYAATGEQLGYGPYPLQANDVTAMRVFWQVQDFTNDLSNVTIMATLPSQVEWTGHSAVTEGGAMTYDASTHTVVWHSSSVPSFSHAQGASFEVRISPNYLQVGKQINITNDPTFSARDSFTGAVLVRTLGPLRTDKPIEPEAR